MDNTTTMSPMDEFCDFNNYKCSDKGLILPLVSEKSWPIAGRAALYLIGLFWCFLGVAIIADIFMCSIEKITSKTNKIKVANNTAEGGYEEIEVKVWNGTVANLTLMALGSSAPEILLSVIEICVKNNFLAGDLGPSTIVGSAAFNLLVITAVCVLAIPSPDTRRIKEFKVFAITAFFCVFAYIWLIIILVGITPNYVDLGEAIVTLLFFPILVVLAYLADKNFFRKSKDTDKQKGGDIPIGFERGEDKDHVVWGQKNAEVDQLLEDLNEGKMTDEKMRIFIRKLSELHPNLKEDDIVKLASARLSEETEHNHLWYRINATRHLGGNPKLTPAFSERLHDVYESLKHTEEGDRHSIVDSYHGSTVDFSYGGSKAVVEFTAAQSAVMEGDKRVRVSVRRYGKMNSQVVFRLETIDGTAEATKDYIPVKETMVFDKDEDIKHIDIEIIDDNEWEPDEVFFVKLSLDPKEPSTQTTILGKKAIQEVTIINDDDPGVFEFSKPSLLFKESAGKAMIPIERHSGGDGRVTLKYTTHDMTAHSGKDFDGGEGTVVFEHGEMTKTLEITIYDDKEMEKDECFKVELMEIVDCEGAKIGRIKKSIITIVNDDDFNGMVSRLVDLTNMNMDALRVDSTTWSQQFRNAMNANGGDIESASHMDYIMHFFTFGWKILFALVPPPSIWGGWLAFFFALLMIAILTAIIGDLASIFGCLVGLKDSVTAITFVALGTSLPDLFASKQAAMQEKHADNSIGNVTGSNSVNVFLGLGLPWVIAAAYWTAKGKRFRVEAGSLSFSVVIYAITACLCLGMLIVRRFVPAFGKAELGGTKNPKIITAISFVCMWILYVLLSAFQAYEYIPNF